MPFGDSIKRLSQSCCYPLAAGSLAAKPWLHVKECFAHSSTRNKGAVRAMEGMALAAFPLLPSMLVPDLLPLHCCDQGTDTTGAGLALRLTSLQQMGFSLHWRNARGLIASLGDEPEALELLLSVHPSLEWWSGVKALEHSRTACLQLLMERGALAPSRYNLAQLLREALHKSQTKQQLFTALWLVEHLTGEGAVSGRRRSATR